MELKTLFATDNHGNVTPGALAYLYQAGTTTPVTGLLDVNGDPLANPFTAGADGLLQFRAVPGEYDLRITYKQLDRKIRVQFLDAADVDADAAGSADAAAAFARQRANHTGTQDVSTVNGLPDRLAALEQFDADLANATDPQKGAGLVGWRRSSLSSAISSVGSSLSAKPINVWEFAGLITSKPNPADPSTWDWTPAFNGAIAAAAVQGGGDVLHTPGVWTVLGSIYLVSRVHLKLLGVKLVGNGSNNIFESGWLDGMATASNVGEYGTGHTGNGTHWVDNALVYGAETDNCAMSARLHRFNYASTFKNCILRGSQYSIWSTHGWGQRYEGNFVRSPMRLQDFVDWTTVEGNSFEFCKGNALIIGHPTTESAYGGSWTLRIINNGFHHTSGDAGEADAGTAILLRMEVDNCEISGNHFESQKRHIVGDIRRCEKIVIRNNHLAAQVAGVEAVTFVNLRNSRIEKNDWVVSGGGSFNYHVSLNTSNTFGNEIEVPYSTTSTAPDLSMYLLADTNRIKVCGGSNNASITQPYGEEWSGSGQYTIEKYRAKYRYSGGNIPFCTHSLVGNTLTLDTFVDTDARGTFQPVMCNLRFHGSANTMEFIGHVAGLTVAPIVLRTRFGPNSPPTVVASDSGGKLRLTFSGVPSDTVIRGWVKEL